MSSLLPASLDAGSALLLIAISLGTSAITAAFGVGGGVAMLAAMGYVLPPAALIAIHGCVQLGSNAGRLYVQRRHVDWKVILPFIAGSLCGAALGVQVFTSVAQGLQLALIGAFVAIAGWLKLPPLPVDRALPHAAAGAGTTFLSVFIGASGPLTAIFFAHAADDRRHYAAQHAAAMTFQHGFKVLALMATGFVFAQWAGLIVAMVVSGYLGTLLGSRMLDAMPEARFRLAFKLLVTILGLDLARRGLMQASSFDLATAGQPA